MMMIDMGVHVCSEGPEGATETSSPVVTCIHLPCLRASYYGTTYVDCDSVCQHTRHT